MEENGIDPRFPAMYQAGGEGVPQGAPPETVIVRRPAAPGPVPQDAGPGSLTTAGVAVPANGPERNEVTGGNLAGGGLSAVVPDGQAAFDAHFAGAAPIQWLSWRWLIPVVMGLLFIAAGVFCLGAQYWIPSSLEMDPSKFHGIQIQPWSQLISQAAPALLGMGSGILGGLLFLASRRRAALEPVLRGAFGLLVLAVGVAGWMALFGTVIFTDISNQSSAAYDGSPRQTPITYVLMPCGTWLLAAALLMLAVLFVVPRRWRHVWPDHDGTLPDSGLADGGGAALRGEMPPNGGGPSVWRGLCFGAVAVAAAAFALFAPYLFPLSTGMQTVATDDGGAYSQQAWADMAWLLVTPLLLAGLAVLAWACLHLAVMPRRADGDPTAELDGTVVVP